FSQYSDSLLVFICDSASFFVLLIRSLSLSLRPPPTSTLFPYTTLFRSLPGRFLVSQVGYRSLRPEVVFRRIGMHAGPIGDDGFEDRKSTRLNSSHQII